MHAQAVDGEWDIPRLTKDAYDLKGKTVGTVAAGRIGCHVIRRLKVGFHPQLSCDGQLCKINQRQPHLLLWYKAAFGSRGSASPY